MSNLPELSSCIAGAHVLEILDCSIGELLNGDICEGTVRWESDCWGAPDCASSPNGDSMAASLLTWRGTSVSAKRIDVRDSTASAKSSATSSHVKPVCALWRFEDSSSWTDCNRNSRSATGADCGGAEGFSGSSANPFWADSVADEGIPVRSIFPSWNGAEAIEPDWSKSTERRKNASNYIYN